MADDIGFSTEARHDFRVHGGPAIARRNLPRLRKEMQRLGLDGLWLPHDDEFLNEYLPAHLERLAWATGFTGSAGAALILQTKAILFVDGRYTLQAKAQTDADLFDYADLWNDGVRRWFQSNLPQGAVIGYDPWTIGHSAATDLQDMVSAAGGALRALSVNPVDLAWRDRPAAPKGPALAHGVDLAGESVADKLGRVRAALGERADALIASSPLSVAWLFNMRGTDVPRTPVALARAIIGKKGPARLFLDPAKFGPELKKMLGDLVEIAPLERFDAELAGLGGKRVSLDPATTPSAAIERLRSAGAEIRAESDPVALMRAQKNATEVDGSRAAHQRDGVAVAKFLHWLASEAQSGQVDEITAAERLLAFRRESNLLRDLSFDTISGAGPNGAIVHYRVNEKTNRKLKRGSLFLVDSGGQYPDGTTDITRTVPIGRPTPEMRDRFTRVLKGHIALSVVRFPPGTTGTHLDALARMHLWAAGVDYEHGTGHGVGSYLSVHEGPQRIARAWNATPLAPGMIVSNEPGYYKTGAYGIRIENLQVVTAPEMIEGGEKPMLGFETLTLAPIALTLIDKKLLSGAERDWLNAYHARVRAALGGQVSGAAAAWLQDATAPI